MNTSYRQPSCGIQGTAPAHEAEIQVVRGRDVILRMLPTLAELSRRCLQSGAMDHLNYFLGNPYFGTKIPTLLLFSLRPEKTDAELTAGEIAAAVLVHEYQVLGFGTGVFVTDDQAGERNTVAPEAVRSEVAARACKFLMERGARLVMTSVRDGHFPRELSGSPHPAWLRVSTERHLVRCMPLMNTFDETLSTMGPHTRRNLRYYRRRAETQMGSSFFPAAEISEPDFLALNRVSAYPVPDEIAAWRRSSAMSIEGGFLAGVRAADGRWLSLIGGRRIHGRTAVDWQMNRNDLTSFSLSTVTRSYFVEHEISRKMQMIVFEGGTPHSMKHAFLPERVAYLITARRSLPGWMLRHAARTLLPENNFLAATLSMEGLDWQPW